MGAGTAPMRMAPKNEMGNAGVSFSTSSTRCSRAMPSARSARPMRHTRPYRSSYVNLSSPQSMAIFRPRPACRLLSSNVTDVVALWKIEHGDRAAAIAYRCLLTLCLRDPSA